MQIGSKHWWLTVEWNGEKAAAAPIAAKCSARWVQLHAICTMKWNSCSVHYSTKHYTTHCICPFVCLHGVANKTYDSPTFDWYMVENWKHKHTNRFAIRACLQQIILCHNKYTFVCTPINISNHFIRSLSRCSCAFSGQTISIIL